MPEDKKETAKLTEQKLISENDSQDSRNTKVEQLMALEFSNIEFGNYPPMCRTEEQKKLFDSDISAITASKNSDIDIPIPESRIRHIVCGYTHRIFILNKVMPAASELANKLEKVIQTYLKRDQLAANGLLEQLTRASVPLAEAMERLESHSIHKHKGGQPKMSLGLLVADLARLFEELTGNVPGISKGDSRDGTYNGGPFARFSYEIYKLALRSAGENPSESAVAWSETVAPWLTVALAYNRAVDRQLKEYDSMAEEDFKE